MNILIKNGTIHDGKGRVFDQADLFIEDGKIKKIEKKIEWEAERVIHAEGKTIFPGFIDPLTGWGCAAGRSQSRDNDEKSEAFTPELSAFYAFDPKNMMYQELWGFGITSAGISPSNTNILGGQIAVFKSWGESLEDMLVKEKVALKGSVTEATQEFGSRNEKPMTRMELYHLLEKAVENAKSEEQEEKKKEKNQAFRKVLEGEKPLIINANTSADMDSLLRVFAKEEKLQFILANSYGITKRYVKENVGLILGDLTDGFSKHNAKVDFEAFFDCVEAGKLVALSAFGDGTSPGREVLLWNVQEILRQGAKHHRKLSNETILSLVTSNPAKMLGVEDRVGSLEVGLDADLVIWSQNPLESYQGKVETVLISGKIVGEK